MREENEKMEHGVPDPRPQSEGSHPVIGFTIPVSTLWRKLKQWLGEGEKDGK